MEHASPTPITEAVMRAVPAPSSVAHKGMAGRVLVVGGCERYAGAPRLAALAALRTGAGLVTVAAPAPWIPRILAAMPDAMALPLDGPEWAAGLAVPCADLAARCDAVVLGPGLGRGPGRTAFAAAFLARADRPPCVVDADALAAVKAAGALPLLRADDVLTPHPGEAAALLDASVGDVEGDRDAALRALTALSPGVWVLKGAGALVGRRGLPAAVLRGDEPNLSVGGAGDVLAGCIAAYVAQGASPDAAARAGVLTHSRAGHLLRRTFPARGNLAGDIADALPAARASLTEPGLRLDRGEPDAGRRVDG